MADNYDAIYVQADYFGAEPSALLEKYAEWIPAGARVLDIGAGQGRNALPLAARGCRVTALEPSTAALDALGKRAAAENLDITLVPQEFLDYEPTGAFDVILCFGLMQVLHYEECASLVNRLHHWLVSGGTLFLTAWHMEDPSFAGLSTRWEPLGIRSFRSPDGASHRLFLEKGEIVKLFFRWQPVHHWEGMGPWHSHGDGPQERHGDVEAILTRP